MKCPKCDGEIDGKGKFCRRCGSALPAAISDSNMGGVCPACNAAVRAGAKFCSRCATPLDGVSKSPAAVSGSGWVRERSTGFLIAPIAVFILALAGLGWYFGGVETIIVTVPPDARVLIDGQQLSAQSYGRFVASHLTRHPHTLTVQHKGFSDSVQQFDSPLSDFTEWITIRLTPLPSVPSAEVINPEHHRISTPQIRDFSSDKAIDPEGSQASTPLLTERETESQDSYPAKFRFLIGEWECLIPGNHLRMRVSWDIPSRQFRGYITKLGIASENVGFRIGEHVWIAEPINEQTLVERVKLRSGANGVSTDYTWTIGNVDLTRSSRDRLVGYAEFMRVR